MLIQGRAHSGRAHSGRAHSERAHSERAHSERAHSERAHSERARSERAHSERAHSERAHSERCTCRCSARRAEDEHCVAVQVLQLVACQCTQEQIPVGTRLLQSGVLSNKLYVIKSGRVSANERQQTRGNRMNVTQTRGSKREAVE